MGQSETTAPPEPSMTPLASTPVDSTTEACHPTCTITSQTFKSSPADRTRTRVGVGEEVTISVTGNPATWEISGGGTISPSTGTQNSVTFTAGETAATVTITATGSGCSCSNVITFTVVEPSDLTMRRKGGLVEHNNPWPDCGWTGLMYVHPNDVNFYRLQIRELDSRAVTTGSYNVPTFTGVYHGNYPPPSRASAWLALTSHTDRHGSKAAAEDHIYSGFPGTAATNAAPPFNVGTMHFPMTWQWRVRGSSTRPRRNFPGFRQRHRITAEGRCSSSKAGNTESALYSDPTSPRG